MPLTRYGAHRLSGWVPVVEPDDHHRLSDAMLPNLHVPGARDPIPTGLYDLTGRELFRLPEPLGFHNPLE